jgi:hypothetical protein
LALLAADAPAQKRESVFFPAAAREQAAANAKRYPWAAGIRAEAVREAERWVRMSDDELWRLMFGPRITRSHMVWSNGFCPACRKPVPMYDWQIDAWARPWKVRCPHCSELFPKNDFAKFHTSGLDERGVFDPKRADRRLLVNLDHPDPADPLHRFGVDDGEGYVEGDKRWRFIGAYLLYGQWTQLIETGVTRLAAAYSMTGDPRYAHKAGVLLDRIADVWPSFDYASQGLVYERARYGGGVAGYVYYAITSAYNVMALVSAYDRIFDGIRGDASLVEFLKGKNAAKRSFAAIQRNIEDNILRHALEHPIQVRTNYPGTERTLALIRTVLEWPANRAALRDELDRIVRKAVAVDGVSGEKGLAGYGAIAPRMLAEILDDYARLDPELLPELLRRNPKLRETYRFHLDTWINRAYYPNSGDAGSFAKKTPQYAGLIFTAPVYGFLGSMGRALADPFYAQLAWYGNERKLDGLPHDIFAEDAGGYARWVKDAVARHGEWPAAASVNKREWRMAILRHRTAPDAAVWLDYDSVPECEIKSHYHFDAMNLGLYAKGLDLLPEFGYPAVQFGDWHTPQALWHKKTAAHNTVVVDGADQTGGATETTLWSAGGPVQAVRASSPAQIKGAAYERTVALVETGPADFYVFDVFRASGGRVHAKHTHTSFAAPQAFGFRPAPAASPYGPETLMRGFHRDPRPDAAWGVDWKIEDRLGYLPAGREVHLRYTELTRGAEAYTAESWTVENLTSTNEYWIPTAIARRSTEAGALDSTFVALLEPHEGKPLIRSTRRLDHEGEAAVRLEVELSDGRRDTLVSGPGGVEWERRDAQGRVEFKGAASGR